MCSEWVQIWFTFHYASTLMGVPFSEKMPDTEFTFHYASTLMADRNGLIQAQNGIYIPLCFYFNSFLWSVLWYSLIFTFHYASTLIFAGSPVTCFPSWFTFHYASTLITRLMEFDMEGETIYIPLCFYFNKWLFPVRATVDFHLHSTMLLL